MRNKTKHNICIKHSQHIFIQNQLHNREEGRIKQKRKKRLTRKY